MTQTETKQLVYSAHKRFGSFEKSEQFLKEKGLKLSRADFYRKLGAAKKDRREQLYLIAQDYAESTVDTINTFHTLEDMLFEIAENPKSSPGDKIRAIREIRELQFDITAYEESTQGTLERDVKLFGDKESTDEKVLSQASSIGRRQN